MTRLFALNPTKSRNPFKDHAFEIALLFAFLLVGLTLLVWPDAALRSPVGRSLAGWQYTWAVMYLVGCPTALYGLFRGSSRARVFGLALAGAGMWMQGVAAVTAPSADFRALSYFSSGAACVIRAYTIERILTRRAK